MYFGQILGDIRDAMKSNADSVKASLEISAGAREFVQVQRSESSTLNIREWPTYGSYQQWLTTVIMQVRAISTFPAETVPWIKCAINGTASYVQLAKFDFRAQKQ